MFNNNFDGNNLNNNGCCPKVIFALLPNNTNPTGPIGPTGPTGPTGTTGADGETPTLTIGEVTTGAPGSEASASITGTAPNFVLNLTIPQGPTGPTGGDI